MREKTAVVLYGSPRNNGNSETLTEALLGPLTATGWDIKRYRVAGMKIAGCIDCRRCWSGGRPCAYEDDMKRIHDAITFSSVLIFATPLYWYTWSAQMKPVIDRMLPYNVSNAPRTLEGKRALLVASAADDAPDCFQGLQFSFRKMCGLLKMPILTEMCVNGLWPRDAVAGRPEVLQQAMAIGQQLAVSG